MRILLRKLAWLLLVIALAVVAVQVLSALLSAA
jgi:hypothetical protein